MCKYYNVSLTLTMTNSPAGMDIRSKILANIPNVEQPEKQYSDYLVMVCKVWGFTTQEDHDDDHQHNGNLLLILFPSFSAKKEDQCSFSDKEGMKAS